MRPASTSSIPITACQTPALLAIGSSNPAGQTSMLPAHCHAQPSWRPSRTCGRRSRSLRSERTCPDAAHPRNPFPSPPDRMRTRQSLRPLTRLSEARQRPAVPRQFRTARNHRLLRSTHSTSRITVTATKTGWPSIRRPGRGRLLGMIARQVADDRGWYQSRAWRRRASASTPASISSSVFGLPLRGRDANTSSGRVSAKAGAGFNRTPSGVSSTRRRVPAPHSLRFRIELGRMTCPLVETVVMSFSAQPSRFAFGVRQT